MFNNSLEHEASAIADKVMRMPAPNFIQRKCTHCEEEQAQHKPLASFIQRKEINSNIVSNAVSAHIQSAKGSGGNMDTSTKSFMESRFGADFSNVKIHAGNNASQLSKELNAQAFTLGNDIYFGEGKYQPQASEGKRLLAHELTHTIQQSGNNNASSEKSIKPYIARFTDDAHHIIDEAALGGFSEEERKDIERGNKLRDYSQLPRALNLALLCNPGKFGGYGQAEHFDNYIWDKDKNEWRDRDLQDAQKAGLADKNIRGSDPIAHIKGKLTSFVQSGRTEKGFTKQGLGDLGIAFHAIEDFFAHSNFVALINGEDHFEGKLLTGSVPGTQAVSLLHTAEDVSARDSAAYYKAAGEEAKKDTDISSHANVANDHLGDKYHIQARRLAALVVQDFSGDLLHIMDLRVADRMSNLDSVVFKKMDRYFRPPDAQKDPWWTTLISEDNGNIDRLLSKAQDETPATVNQCIFSPLRNLEASKDSNIKIIAGGAIPVRIWGARGFVQAGGGLVTPMNLDDATITSDRNDKPAWFAGGQLTLQWK